MNHVPKLETCQPQIDFNPNGIRIIFFEYFNQTCTNLKLGYPESKNKKKMYVFWCIFLYKNYRENIIFFVDYNRSKLPKKITHVKNCKHFIIIYF